MMVYHSVEIFVEVLKNNIKGRERSVYTLLPMNCFMKNTEKFEIEKKIYENYIKTRITRTIYKN